MLLILIVLCGVIAVLYLVVKAQKDKIEDLQICNRNLKCKIGELQFKTAQLQIRNVNDMRKKRP